MAQLIVFRQLSFGRRNFITTPLLLQHHRRFSRLCRVCLQQRKTEDFQQDLTAVQTTNSSSRGEISTEVSLGEKIKENTKTFSYTAIILAGIGVSGIMFYAILRELFSAWSPSNIYSQALIRVKRDPRVQDLIGSPITGFGEQTMRGRRQHTAHHMYERNGVPHMRMQFYVEGNRNKATVHLETKKTPTGKIEYRYLFVQLDNYPRSTIIIEDNRAFDPSLLHPSLKRSNIELTAFSDK